MLPSRRCRSHNSRTEIDRPLAEGLDAEQVNERVADEEFKDHSGDPFFPKVQWPPPELCPLCRAPSVTAGAGKGVSDAEPEWNEDEVCRLLLAPSTLCFVLLSSCKCSAN